MEQAPRPSETTGFRSGIPSSTDEVVACGGDVRGLATPVESGVALEASLRASEGAAPALAH